MEKTTLLLVLLAGCSATEKRQMDDRKAETAPTDGVPMIQSLGTNVSRLTMGQKLRFVLVATHPAGLEQLAGGRVHEGAVQYGALQAVAAGSYQLDLTWDEIDLSSPISFESQERRVFEVEIFDRAGHSVSRSLEIELHCSGLAACGGVCRDLSQDSDNCGDCGVKVAAPRACVAGRAACSSGSYCAGTNSCADLMTDSQNCGQCGVTVRAPYSACAGGFLSCGKAHDGWDLTYCDPDLCIDERTDVNYCGGCGRSCANHAGTVSICQDSNCRFSTTTFTLETCNTTCAKKGLACFDGDASYGSPIMFVNIGCSTVPPGANFNNTLCTCKE